MLTERDVVQRVQHLTVTRLRVWVAQGWIKPADQAAPSYSEADLARAALICNLEDELGFAEEDVPVLLNLIDQIHGSALGADGAARRAGGAAARHPRHGEDADHQKQGRRRAVKSVGGPILFVLGVVALTYASVYYGLGRLPGDIVIDRGSYYVYAPITTAVIVSVLLSLVLWLFRRR